MDHGTVTLTVSDVDPGGSGEPGTAAAGGPRAGHPRRRTFTAAYKARMVAEYDSLTEHGARGALLRREGLYQSHIGKWRAAGMAAAVDQRVPVTTTARADRDVQENRRLTAENAKLTAELTRTKAVMEVLGKAHALLEILSESAVSEPTRTR